MCQIKRGAKLEDDFGGDYIKAYDKHGAEVGSVFFGSNPGQTTEIAPSTRIHPDHQRKGLATAMYQLAEKVSGRKMVRDTNPVTGTPGARTLAAEALWSQPNRPFGKSDKDPKYPQIKLAPHEIVAWQTGVDKARSNVEQGSPSRTAGPIDVWRLEDGRHLLTDGHHRIAQGLAAGQKSFDAQVVGQGYTDYWATPNADQQFDPQTIAQPLKKSEHDRHPLIMAAKLHFGLTHHIGEAGYINPDGTMLDFSGRHYSENHPSLTGRRNVDHRELPETIRAPEAQRDALYEKGSNPGTADMLHFMKETGAIRHMPGVGIHVAHKPTDAQLATLAQHYGKSREPLSVDISHPDTGETLNSHEIKRVSLGTLKQHFDKHFGLKKSDPEVSTIYMDRAKRGMDLMFPVTIRGEKFLKESIPFHTSIKLFLPDETDPDEVINRIGAESPCPPGATDFNVEPYEYKSQYGYTAYTLRIVPVPIGMETLYNRLAGLGIDYKLFQPHITVHKQLWDEVKEKNLTAADLDIKVLPLELRRGPDILFRWVLEPVKQGTTTQEGTAFWDQPNRPFGKSEALRSRLLKIRDQLEKALHPTDRSILLGAHNPAASEIVSPAAHLAQGGVHQRFRDMLASPNPHHSIASIARRIPGEPAQKHQMGVSPKTIHTITDKDEAHHYMTKPYHTHTEPGTEAYGTMPISGWATMTNRNLYHAAGLGNMVEKVGAHEHEGVPLVTSHFHPGHISVRSIKQSRAMEPVTAKGEESAAHAMAMPRFDPLQVHQMATMDFLTNNADRHTGNIMTNPQRNQAGYNSLLAIDHDRSFQYQQNPKSLRNPAPPGKDLYDEPSHYLSNYLSRHSQEAPSNINERHREWWKKNSPAIKEQFAKDLESIKDPSVRRHIEQNFNDRAGLVDEWAKEPKLHAKHSLFDRDMPLQVKHYEIIKRFNPLKTELKEPANISGQADEKAAQEKLR